MACAAIAISAPATTTRAPRAATPTTACSPAIPTIGQDVHELFLQLTSLTQTPRLTKLLQSPFGMHEAVVEKIDREARHRQRRANPARIIAKMNSLVDPQVIEALYRASRAGVQIDLIIRGLCALRPGIPGVSDNIRVRSIVGRFLEHSRVFFSATAATSELYLASADWMERNFFRRVEIAFPVREETHRERILRDLNSYLADNTQAWTLGRDGTTRAASAATIRRATPRARCWRATPPAARRSSYPDARRYFAVKTRSRNPTLFRFSISCCRSATVSG